MKTKPINVADLLRLTADFAEALNLSDTNPFSTAFITANRCEREIRNLLFEGREEIARILCERDHELRLLQVAKCPSCDGSGAINAGDHQDQCQWCDERRQAVAPLNPANQPPDGYRELSLMQRIEVGDVWRDSKSGKLHSVNSDLAIYGESYQPAGTGRIVCHAPMFRRSPTRK